ncbi:secretory immunoglobulin A-binding protein EsiB-like [Periplaneta americana]|uniref:secretory immunoglobulin A-binding protein EsiB-like n=1 Tax=Periplaneta americana TaxID=6978 RepID=UPI0037E8FF2D
MASLLLLYAAFYHCDVVGLHLTRAYAHVGHQAAQHALAQRYLQGVGVQRNKTVAFHWFRKAAYQGHPHSSYNLALGHFMGYRSGLQRGEAYRYMKLAASKGMPQAQHIMDTICSQGHCET